MAAHAPVLVCLDDPPPSGSGACVNEAWIQQPSLLPTLSISDAQDIGLAFLGALVAVMVVKIAGKKTQ